ncbi:tRNA A37 threonylcarbamoyladenosine dehydratase [Breznakia blatticola]|uniref:tRNA A37 threonylcarbamoyladenosine dehydratase n=1 Tax=Breznakia blatticola TaxID=1754012 RepID=A0A4R7ZD63_9FIRM|nr:tRNA threonylcarbamoyladenosine dehydratase [Breznakia blatticola]TDW14826.1 tRNA A37 threonylcarbamoyladenosine dehydratase [Breznakia blatticola]
MENQFIRSEMLLTENGIKTLQNSHVAVFGVGGVGGHCIETLVRSGVKEVSIIDNDTVSLSNLNRQIVALHSTIGQSKVEVMKKRLLDINPDAIIHTYETFVLKDTINEIDLVGVDYIIDCIDTMVAKILLIEKAKEIQIPIICSMGTGNKLDPTKLQIGDISKTSYDPVAKVLRRELKARHIKKVEVLWSTEQPIKPMIPWEDNPNITKRNVPGSVAFMPNIAGIMLAGHVILQIIDKK